MKFVVSKKGPKVLFPWNYIGQGMEAKVYRKGNMAYKYYHFFPYCDRLTLVDVGVLEDIETSRILLPRDTLYTIFGRFKGYTTQYIKNLGLLHFMNLSTDLIIDNFHLLNEDCNLLGENHIVISDLIPKDYDVFNHSFHNGLYFIDPGRFYQDGKLAEQEVFFKNQEQIDDFLYYRVLSRYANEEIGIYNYEYSRLYQIREEAMEKNISLMNFIESDIKEDNLGDYVKRKVL